MYILEKYTRVDVSMVINELMINPVDSANQSNSKYAGLNPVDSANQSNSKYAGPHTKMCM